MNIIRPYRKMYTTLTRALFRFLLSLRLMAAYQRHIESSTVPQLSGCTQPSEYCTVCVTSALSLSRSYF